MKSYSPADGKTHTELENELQVVFNAYPEYHDPQRGAGTFEAMVNLFAADNFYNLHLVACEYLKSPYAFDDSNSLEGVHVRIDQLTALADARRPQGPSCMASAMGGASIDFLAPAERDELHQLKMMLPTLSQEREAASERLALRLAARRGVRAAA